ncbi:cbb3-type cytochrome oxidase assembly protein CcoS [Aquincola sp. S2]|uniref:Cbb3-type cytochrome oxidase assembly protein CcoS n=1 Tax=Pseudaquabacterium terrae TaxID=2732868 RepID=A0ABX2ER21_9BURK|nr:cbb3-type cytochrome oxidase assembly protein CcoS [Aquabacterium terrae]NRF70961.1 cbb3-type cytochrome oxidase assembly protein CcoS [Aquabacterium terrae]
MDILFLLVPLSVVLVLAIIVVFAWALHGGQFDNLEREGERILWDGPVNLSDIASKLAPDQLRDRPALEQSQR